MRSTISAKLVFCENPKTPLMGITEPPLPRLYNTSYQKVIAEGIMDKTESTMLLVRV